jgi:predicted nucleic acid-binding protein
VIYLDTSALITLITERPGVVDLEAYLQGQGGADLATSTVGLIETVRSCDSMASFPNLMAHLLRDYTELVVTADIRDRAADQPGGLKTLDAIHVATAETLGEELTSFVTYDRQMARLAESRGLPVLSPGMTR